MPRAATATTVLVGLLLFAEILLFGANQTDLALAFAGLWFLALPVVLGQGWARRGLEGTSLGLVGWLFGAVLLAGVLTLTRFAVGGPHPIWDWVANARPVATIDPYLTLVELIKLAGLAAVFLIGVVFGSDDERAKTLFRCLLVLGLAYSLWAIVDRVTSPTLLFGVPRTFDPNRLSASLVSANTAATLFGALMLLNLIDLDRRFQRYRAGDRIDIRRLERLAPEIALPLVSVAATASCLLLTVSRAGLAATAAIAIVLIGVAALMRMRQGAISVPVLAMLTVLVGVILASFAMNLGLLNERLTFLNGDALARRDILAVHWLAFKAAMLSGYGLGSFSHVNTMITDRANIGILGTLGAVHNVYLQWLEQAGVIGAAPMFLCVAVIAWRVGRGALKRRRMRSWLVGVLAVLALFLIHGATDFALEVPAMSTLLSLLLGIGYAVAGASAQGARPDSRPHSSRVGRHRNRAVEIASA